MEITKREIIASIAIAAVMLIVGFLISGKITDYQNDKNAEYQKAVHIEDSEIFQHGMNTNIGNAFVYGDLKAVDTVTFDEIGGEYMYVEKIKEKRTRHTRMVKTGKTYSTRVYYTWDRVESEEKKCKEIEFCGVTFSSEKISIPDSEYIDTIKESSKIRYKYYGVSAKYTGTIYTRLSDGTISDNSRFFENMTAEQVLESCTSGIGNVIFWIFWIFLTGGSVFGFCYFENRWLED